jgi:nucleoid-associated protein YgaU
MASPSRRQGGRDVPVKPDSRFSDLPVLAVRSPDGSERQVIALRLARPLTPTMPARHRVTRDEPLDLLARRLYGDEGLWWQILDANPVVYPLDLAPGALLSLPEPGPATRITRARSF